MRVATEKDILEAAFVSELIQLGLMWQEDIKNKKIAPCDYPITKNPLRVIKKSKIKKNIIIKSKARQAIDKKLKISEVAIKYGLKVKNKKIICPFHKDTDPSLSIDDNLNVFYCFGCNVKGDIIEFIRRLEEWIEKKQQLKH